MKSRRFWRVVSLVLFFNVSLLPALLSQTAASIENTNKSVVELQLEMTNAFHQVAAIVNRPPRAFARTSQMDTTVFENGWFHAGATKPDFSNVDVRQSQEVYSARYKSKYVASDLNLKMVFLTEEIEFNAATKFFYTNRTLPKRKLTEAEMLQINDLYRIIGRCERAIMRIQNPIEKAVADVGQETETVVPDQSLASLRSIPQEQRILYGACAIGGLIVLVLIFRLVRKRSG